MCFLLFEISGICLPIFWKSFVYDIATAVEIEKEYEVMHDLKENGKISRNAETRCNSRIRKMIELQKCLEKPNSENASLELVQLTHAIVVLTPFLTILNRAQSDNYDWGLLYTELKSQAKQMKDLGYDQFHDIILHYLSWVKNPVTICLQIIGGDIFDIAEGDVEKCMKWVEKTCPNVLDNLENRYFQCVVGEPAPLKHNLKIFANEFLKKFATSEAAVEHVFSRYKLVHSKIRASLKDEIVEKILFIW